jgi:hypothetical protein
VTAFTSTLCPRSHCACPRPAVSSSIRAPARPPVRPSVRLVSSPKADPKSVNSLAAVRLDSDDFDDDTMIEEASRKRPATVAQRFKLQTGDLVVRVVRHLRSSLSFCVLRPSSCVLRCS